METPRDNNVITWRALNREGCEMGRANRKEMDTMATKIKDMESKIDAMTKALVGAALTFGTAALMLALNLIF